jgi:hypothetical protein
MRGRSVKSGRSMEIVLNLAWALVAIAGVCLWERTETRTGRQRHLPCIALVMLIIILFPVISVSDDLWSIQNPAETDTCQRRDHLTPCTHLIIPDVVSPPEAVFEQPEQNQQRLSATLREHLPISAIYASNEVANRPPPIA